MSVETGHPPGADLLAGTDLVSRERRFFLFMALLLIGCALLGFGFFQYAGISTWNAPWWVHVHAFSQMGWLGFFALQNALVVRGDIAVHRRLGMFGAGFAAWIVICALSLSYLVISTGRDDGLFTAEYLLALNLCNVLAFAVLFAAAFRMRRQSDWHKRLMLCAVIVLSLPSFGRTLVMLGIAGTLSRTLFVLSFIVIAMLADWRMHNRVHPAYFWGAGTTLVMGAMIATLPLLAPFAALAHSFAP